MKVKDLVGILETVDPETEMWFSYDARCAERPINRVDLETRKDGSQYLFFREEKDGWERRNKQDYARMNRINEGLFYEDAD